MQFWTLRSYSAELRLTRGSKINTGTAGIQEKESHNSLKSLKLIFIVRIKSIITLFKDFIANKNKETKSCYFTNIFTFLVLYYMKILKKHTIFSRILQLDIRLSEFGMSMVCHLDNFKRIKNIFQVKFLYVLVKLLQIMVYFITRLHQCDQGKTFGYRFN